MYRMSVDFTLIDNLQVLSNSAQKLTIKLESGI